MVATNVNPFSMLACPHGNITITLENLAEGAAGGCIFKYDKLAELTRLLLIHLNT